MTSLPTVLAFFDVGGGEMLIVFFLVLMLFGGEKLPEFARGLGKSIREFKKASAGVEEEFRRAMAEPPVPRNEMKRPLPPPAPQALAEPVTAETPDETGPHPAPEAPHPSAPPPAHEPLPPPSDV